MSPEPRRKTAGESSSNGESDILGTFPLLQFKLKRRTLGSSTLVPVSIAPNGTLWKKLVSPRLGPFPGPSQIGKVGRNGYNILGTNLAWARLHIEQARCLPTREAEGS